MHSLQRVISLLLASTMMTMMFVLADGHGTFSKSTDSVSTSASGSLPILNFTELAQKYPRFLSPSFLERVKSLPFYDQDAPSEAIHFKDAVNNSRLAFTNELIQNYPRNAQNLPVLLDYLNGIVEVQDALERSTSNEPEDFWQTIVEREQREYMTLVLHRMYGTITAQVNRLIESYAKQQDFVLMEPTSTKSTRTPPYTRKNEDCVEQEGIWFCINKRKRRLNLRKGEWVWKSIRAIVLFFVIMTIVWLVWMVAKWGRARRAKFVLGSQQEREDDRRRMAQQGEVAQETIEMVQV